MPASSNDAAAKTPVVHFTHEVEPAALRAVFDAIDDGLSGKVGVKLLTGEPGGNRYLKAGLISSLVSAVAER